MFNARPIARLAILAGLAVSACAWGNDMNQTVWDFSTPLSPADLGSRVSEFQELEGELDLKVIFPSGVIVEGVWGWGARAAAYSATDEEPLPVDEVLFFESPATDLDELRASAERFLERWGPASGSRGSIENFMSATTVINEREGTPIGQTYPIGQNVARFVAEVQDGLTPAWGVRFTGDIVTIRITLQFEPAAR